MKWFHLHKWKFVANMDFEAVYKCEGCGKYKIKLAVNIMGP